MNTIKKFIEAHRVTQEQMIGTLGFAFGTALMMFAGWNGWTTYQQFKQERFTMQKQLEQAKHELATLKQQDQYVMNKKLEEEISNIEETYGDAVSAYEALLMWKPYAKDTRKLDELFADALTFLSKRNYASASGALVSLRTGIKDDRAKLAATSIVPENMAVNNAAPASGYSRQRVDTDAGSFLVDTVAGDLSSTRVIVDTASDGTCIKDCPVTSLGDYVSRSGAYAGVNGSYFCPAEYPSCTDKKNSFDTLLMNKNKVYFNSDNNVYSTVPAVIFLGGSVRFVGQSLEWGRDTGVDGVIANRPALVMGGNIVFSGEGEPKEGNRGNRSFVANKGNVVYIGVVHSASVAESAKVMKALGMDNALNLDNGGSTALWSGGYRVGPGRNIPNAILFVRK